MTNLINDDMVQTLNNMKKQAILNVIKNNVKALAVTGITAFGVYIWCMAGSTWWVALPIISIVWYLYVSSIVAQVTRCVEAIDKATQAGETMDRMVEQANALVEKFKSDNEDLNN